VLRQHHHDITFRLRQLYRVYSKVAILLASPLVGCPSEPLIGIFRFSQEIIVFAASSASKGEEALTTTTTTTSQIQTKGEKNKKDPNRHNIIISSYLPKSQNNNNNISTIQDKTW
jgi:hypothetical protein